jgi:XisH protein
MPRKDIYHESVRIALEKDGWTVTDDPLQIAVDETTIFIDLSVEPTYFAV